MRYKHCRLFIFELFNIWKLFLNFAMLIFLAKPEAEVIVSHHLLNFIMKPAPIYMHINVYCMLMYFQIDISSCYQCSFINIGNTHWCKDNSFLLSQHILVRNHNIAMHPTEVIFVLHFRSSISSLFVQFLLHFRCRISYS